MIAGAHSRLSPRAVASQFRELELNEILRVLNSKLAVLPMVAGFEIAQSKGDARHREYLTQIRAAPLGGSASVEFRYAMKLDDSGRAGFEDVAWDILGCAHSHLVHRTYAELCEAARAAAERIVTAAAGGPLPPCLVAVGLAYDFHHEDPLLTADLEMLGNDLKPGIERITAQDLRCLARDVASLVDAHRARVEAAVQARSARSIGWVTQAALRIMDAARLGRRSTIEAVHAHGDVGLSFAGPDGRSFRANLLHTDGVIVGSIIPRDRRWNLRCDDLVVWGEGLPEVICASLEGRRLGELFQNRELPEDAVIVSVEEVTSVDPGYDDDDEVDGWLKLKLEVPMAEIDEDSGEAREAVTAISDFRHGRFRPPTAASWSGRDFYGGEEQT